MRRIEGILCILLFVAADAAAQQPEPGAWYLSPSPTGVSVDARFVVETNATGTALQWAPFGKTPVSWGPIAMRQDGSIEFHSAGDPPLQCTLRRTGEGTYAGTCRSRGEIERKATMGRNQANGLDLPVSDTDFRILAKARQILSGPSVWYRRDTRSCENSAKQNSWSLFCALYQASFDETGDYVHLRPAMEEVRAALAEITQYRSFGHPLMDYNNLESTTYADIKTIFEVAKKRLETRTACTESRDSNWSVNEGPASPTPGSFTSSKGWGEGLSFFAAQKRYRLVEVLGPMADHARVPDEWLAASSEVARRTWKQDRLDGLDVKGTLPNGNHWRYFCLCGESWRYYDVPTFGARQE